jgi:hypothetical protein
MKLADVVPWGRSLKEYREMFALTADDLQKSILGCGDGPASFNAELSATGGTVVSVDPIYCLSTEQLRSRISEVYEEIMAQLERNRDLYVWDSLGSVEALGNIRLAAMEKFLEDYDLGKKQGRYVEGSLPQLDFADNQFDLALCSHYLFLYSEQISVQAHIDSLQQLCRVAKEVRVYPLVSLDGEPSPHLSLVISELERFNLSVNLIEVSYQFQKGATQMLVTKSI